METVSTSPPWAVQICSFSTHPVAFTPGICSQGCNTVMERLCSGRSTLPRSPGGPWELCPMPAEPVGWCQKIGASLPRATFPLFCRMDFHCVIQFSCQYKPPYTYCTSQGTWQLPSMRQNNNQHQLKLPPTLPGSW